MGTLLLCACTRVFVCTCLYDCDPVSLMLTEEPWAEREEGLNEQAGESRKTMMAVVVKCQSMMARLYLPVCTCVFCYQLQCSLRKQGFRHVKRDEQEK